MVEAAETGGRRLGGWQAGAVTNADLGFETLRQAEASPERLREQRRGGPEAGRGPVRVRRRPVPSRRSRGRRAVRLRLRGR